MRGVTGDDAYEKYLETFEHWRGRGWRVTAAGPTTSIREEPYQGDIIRRYGVRAVIGKGGMGAVYEAWQAGLERRVAIKFLLPDFARHAEPRHQRLAAMMAGPDRDASRTGPRQGCDCS